MEEEKSITTKLFSSKKIKEAAKILRDGGIVAIPTETVYGLAADALNGRAVKKIFYAKGRPIDNPLIVHICSVEEAQDLVSDFPNVARKLAEKFWPGPLTIILPKSKIIPDEVSAGLDTVAIRIPDHEIALKLIEKTGRPLAAPSANLSGKPSPTCAEHVISDLYGKIDAILDGGLSKVGVESTVISLTHGKPCILRPGGVTKKEIENVIGKIELDMAVLNRVDNNDFVISPGLKYKHYSPKAKVIVLTGSRKKYLDYINSCESKERIGALCFDEDVDKLEVHAISYGREKDYKKQAELLFASLRRFDEYDINTIYARCPDIDDLGLAVYNRLIRAAGFEVISLD